MTIIDVDSHFEPVSGWVDDVPGLRDQLPQLLPEDDPRFRMNSGEMFAYFVSDDLLRNVPRASRMPMDRLATPAMKMMFSGEAEAFAYEGASQFKQLTDPARRVQWLDEQGIAIQAVITGEGYTLARAIRDPLLGMQALTAINTWMSDALADHRDRLLPVTCLRFEDLDWVVAEMTRMRERGSRTFLISSEPVNGIPVTHPAYDRVWDAATDLGMVAHLHIGMSPSMYHPGWANTDDPALIRLISVLQPHQTAQIMVNAMVFSGVFERHPTLTVLLSELGVDWIPGTVARMDALAEPGVSPLVLGDYRLPLRPGEYVCRNIRVSPLPAAHESPIPMMQAVPGVAVFSSDYPHFEGSPDPVGHYRALLRNEGDVAVKGFLGDSIAECFARMGDPLPL